MITYANRASAVLYSFLKRGNYNKPFLLPANVCPVVPLSFMKANVDFEFVDIDETHAMSTLSALDKLEKSQYSGLLFVHAYGHQYENAEFYQSVKNLHPSLTIIDDKCLCKPDLSGQLQNNVDLALYSTGYAKYVELSFGGYGVSEKKWGRVEASIYSVEDETKQQIYIKECLRNNSIYEWPHYYPWLDCSSLQMTPEQYFSIIHKKLPSIDQHKERINAIYMSNLPESIILGDDFTDWRFMIEVNNREQLLNAIFEEGLFAGTNFPSVSWMFKRQHCNKAENESQKIVNLFNDFRVNENFAMRLCDTINRVL